MHRVMDEYDMKDALFAAITKYIQKNKMTRIQFSEMIGKNNAWVYQCELKTKVKITSLELIAGKIGLVYRLTIGGSELYFDNFTELYNAFADYCKAKRQFNEQTITEVTEILGSQYPALEKKSRMEQPIFFRTLNYFGGKLHLGLGQVNKTDKAPEEHTFKIIQLPKQIPGNGRVLNSFTGW